MSPPLRRIRCFVQRTKQDATNTCSRRMTQHSELQRRKKYRLDAHFPFPFTLFLLVHCTNESLPQQDISFAISLYGSLLLCPLARLIRALDVTIQNPKATVHDQKNKAMTSIQAK